MVISKLPSVYNCNRYIWPLEQNPHWVLGLCNKSYHSESERQFAPLLKAYKIHCGSPYYISVYLTIFALFMVGIIEAPSCIVIIDYYRCNQAAI